MSLIAKVIANIIIIITWVGAFYLMNTITKNENVSVVMMGCIVGFLINIYDLYKK